MCTQYHFQTHISNTNSLIQENVDDIKVTINEMEKNQSQMKVSIGLLEQPKFFAYFTCRKLDSVINQPTGIYCPEI